jgi:[FeFe] hydrogenase H-cluster radical SAM maturase HydG
LLLTGESPEYTFDDFLKAIKTVSEVETHPHGKIRRINVEIPPLSVSDFRRLKATNAVGTFTVFQETYDSVLYPKYHPSGPKADYDNRVTVMDRAMTAGVDDVGVGVLFGLADYRFEVCALLQHAQHLMSTYNAGPHTISIPRIRPAHGAPTSLDVPFPVSDNDFLKLVAVIRCAVPYTGMIMSTRENKEMRDSLLRLGISQMSAGSKTDVGAYTEKEHNEDENGQFGIEDHRSLDEVVADLMDSGFIPSWCTACYRCGRTGPEFMEIAKRGDIHEYCQPNALLTLKEFALDYASEKTQKQALDLIEQESKSVQQASLPSKLTKLEEGERDLYF